MLVWISAPQLAHPARQYPYVQVDRQAKGPGRQRCKAASLQHCTSRFQRGGFGGDCRSLLGLKKKTELQFGLGEHIPIGLCKSDHNPSSRRNKQSSQTVTQTPH